MNRAIRFKAAVYAILEEIRLALRAAGNPYVDGRDEADSRMDAAWEKVEDLLPEGAELYLVVELTEIAGKKGGDA